MSVMLRTVALCAAAILLAAGVAAAQGLQTGTLRGIVSAAGDVPVPNADVTITSPAMQGSRSATTDSNGTYVVRGLPPGDYSLRFAAGGSEIVTRQANVPLGGVAEVNVRMRVANVAEAVTVVAPALTTPTVGAN